MIDESKVEEGKTVSIEEARALMGKEKRDRAMGCSQEMTAILKKYNCELVGIPGIAPDGTIHAEIQIVPKD
jgi:hypothetical protein